MRPFHIQQNGLASVLMFTGLEQPSGYTEPLLRAWRLKVKAAA